MKVTHTYLLVGDDWAYPGRHLDPCKRLLEHLAGQCKTTAPRIAADKNPPIMVPMEDYDFDLDDPEAGNGEARLLDDLLAGKHISEGCEVLYAVYPYYSKEAGLRGVETVRRNGTGIFDPEIWKMGVIAAASPEVHSRAMATQKSNGVGFWDPEVIARGVAAAHEPEALARMIDTNRKNGTGAFDPKVRDKGREMQRKNGYPNLRYGLHVRWHVNRGITNPECGLCFQDDKEIPF